MIVFQPAQCARSVFSARRVQLFRSGDACAIFADREHVHVEERLRVGCLECRPSGKISEHACGRVLSAKLLDDFRIELKTQKRKALLIQE